jgi:rhamnosyltransferase
VAREASVLVRTLNSEKTLSRCFDSILRQSVRPKIVVVDSGSTDGTLKLAAGVADKIVEIPQSEFTYGKALNLGFRASDTEVVMPLSSHCAFEYDEHIARALDWHRDATVAATTGAIGGPWGGRIASHYRQACWPENESPWWGFSNHSCSVSRAVWERVPFDESIVACEDKLWSSIVLRNGWSIIYDPKLGVSSSHRRKQGLRKSYARGLKEGTALQQILPGMKLSSGLFLSRWYLRIPSYYRLPMPAYWIMPHRMCEVSGLIRGAAIARGRMD